jgi:plasmid stability protein
MAAITVRGLSPETHRALRVRAAHNGRSAEAEIRAILYETVRPTMRLKIGAKLLAFGRRFEGVDLNIARDAGPTEPAIFE